LAIRLNGTTMLAGQSGPAMAAKETRIAVSTLYVLAVNDYVELMAYQSSGGALNVTAESAYTPEFAMARIGA
jgi:hypothetical protein